MSVDDAGRWIEWELKFSDAPQAALLGDSRESAREFNPYPPNCWSKTLRITDGPRPTWRKMISSWIPRCYVGSNYIDAEAFIGYFDALVRRRGVVLWDGQILTTPLSQAIEMDLTFEGDMPMEVPLERPWGEQQRRFFALEDPYQMAEDPDAYSCSSVVAVIPANYLAVEERIIAVLHGGRDGRYFSCTCHHARVVCTTKHRLVCMSCGATHAVFAAALMEEQSPGLTAERWSQLFDADGIDQDAEVELTTLDFQSVEHFSPIWATHQWEQAAEEFIFYARSSPEQIDAAHRGTERDASIFMEAGFRPVETPPPPVFHLLAASLQVDLFGNAEHAVVEGVEGYLHSFTDPSSLLGAIPDLFRAIELILKARLEQISPKGLQDRPNNPTVLALLEKDSEVALSGADVDALDQLRLLRNEIQHGEISLNNRFGLRSCRRGIAFLNRFLDSEFDIWICDALPPKSRLRLLELPEFGDIAARVVEERLRECRCDPDAAIARCETCGEQSLVRPHPSTGAACLRCGATPVGGSDVEA